MKKSSKIFSLLLIPALLVGTLSLTALPVSAASSAGNEKTLNNLINKGKDVSISKNISLEETVVIPEGKSITIDLNGKTLDRGLDFEPQENGSVFIVEEGASLTIKDGSGVDSGTITGGASFLGGGICNYGTLVIKAGTVSGNCAYDETDGFGGGIYNEGDLTLQGGVIKENEANYGGGVYNATGGTITFNDSVYSKQVGNNTTEIPMSADITGNYAEDNKSHGICNCGTVNIEGSPNISENEGNDIYCSYGKKLNITGELDIDAPIGIQAGGTNPTFTSGFKTNIGGDPSDYFTSTNTEASLQLDSEGEAMLKTDEKTKVVVYENATMTKSEEYDSFSDAWSAADSYAQYDNGKTRVEVTLGSDWSGDQRFKVEKGYHITLDLNGHYIKRTRNGSYEDKGYLFIAYAYTHFVIKDSNPNSKGYDGLKGGVLTGGCSTTDCGCIYLYANAQFEMTGGTIYQCKTNNDGGAIYVGASEERQVSLSNCSIRECTANGDGGAIYIGEEIKSLSMDNVTIRDCNAGGYGGAVYFEKTQKGTVRIVNSLFNGNYAQCGGALALVGTIDSSNPNRYLNPHLDFIADNCIFYNNYINYTGKMTYGKSNYTGTATNYYGSAVYLSEYDQNSTNYTDVTKKDLYPVLFRDCVFKKNWCQSQGEWDSLYKRYGSPFYVYQNGLVLDSCTITDNSGGDTPVYLCYKCSVSLQGKTIIKDNENGGINPVSLSEGDCYIYDAGLTEGSYVEIQSVSNNTYVKNTSEYRSKYFHFSDGDLTFSKTGIETAKLVSSDSVATASIFGSGSWIAISIMIAIAATGAVITVIIVKKKRRGGVKDAAK